MSFHNNLLTSSLMLLWKRYSGVSPDRRLVLTFCTARCDPLATDNDGTAGDDGDVTDFPARWTINYITHTRLRRFFSGLPGWAGTRKVKPIWILLKQETVSGIGISWAICKSASRSRQITMPVPHHSVFYRPDALPAAQPSAEGIYITHKYIIHEE